MYALESSADGNPSSGSATSGLRITTEREAENGQGFFQTLAPISKPKLRPSRKQIAHQKRALEVYLQHLQEESALVSVRPSSSETTLIARYISMLGPESAKKQPLSILGTWISSIPSRIGFNPMLDLAVEFLVNSYAVYWDDTHSKRKLASATKAKALRELQLVVLNSQSKPSYEVLLATKLHYAAEALMGIDTMYHAIHAFGLAQLLTSGAVSNVDDEHFWNLIDNTYIDDVNEAMLAGRKSVYDNEFYLSSTYPPAYDSDVILLSASQRASMAIMHVFIQCPRLVCLIRHAIENPEDTSALATAVSHAESLWLLDLPKQTSGLIHSSVTSTPVPVSADMADLMPDSLEFDSVQSMILCTRYWMLQNVLCGLADALYVHFPTETAASLLPSPEVIRNIDVEAALQLAKSLPWSLSVSQTTLPLVPLRLHTPLQLSIGPWHRILRGLVVNRSTSPDLGIESTTGTPFEISRAERMKTWLVGECNRIHKQWDVSVVDERPLLEALDSMAGEKIPDWLPVRVRFEAEDGEMVMKLDYENRTGSYQERYHLREKPPKRTANPATPEGRWQRENLSVQELPFRSSSSPSPAMAFDSAQETYIAPSLTSMRPADFIHSTGRNLCSTSGWWPDTSTTSTVLLDSTHKASAFSNLQNHKKSKSTQLLFEHNDSHPNLASDLWPQTPKTSTKLSNNTSNDARLSPTWSETLSVTFENEKKNACLSPAWSNNS
ncbi:Nn.00g010850.m01.CDS01 [Neocucurbitaria sp. VM-36]